MGVPGVRTFRRPTVGVAVVVVEHGDVLLVKRGYGAKSGLWCIPCGHVGVEVLEPGEPIFPEDLEAAEEAAGVRIQSGDALLVRTGRWRWEQLNGPWETSLGLAGLDASCLAWLHGREVALLGCDGISDVQPSRVEGVPMPIHTVVIVAMGVHLLDNLDLEDLAGACADEGRWDFLLTVAPLILRRGTASPVNPIALF
jgi:kynurenine formamidase